MNVAQQLNDILVAADCHQIQAVYAGIGARKTPGRIFDIMTRIARKLDKWGWMLRSGGSDGADTAFAAGAKQKGIYLPWPRFNKNDGVWIVRDRPSARAMEIAATYHPNWDKLSEADQKFHARNVHEILGADCKRAQNELPADLRCAFVDFVDSLARDGTITETLARKVTL